MKFIIMIMILFLCIKSFSQTEQESVDSVSIDLYIKKDYSKYIGKPVFLLLLDNDIRLFESFSIHQEPPLSMSGLNIYLGNDICLEVHFIEEDISKYPVHEWPWDMEEILTERIWYINLIQNDFIYRVIHKN